MCTDGSRAPLTAYAECSLGKVPSHAVVMSKKASREKALRVMEMVKSSEVGYCAEFDSSTW